MQFFSGDADQIGQARFDIHVHVFLLDGPDKFAALDFAADLRQSPANIPHFQFGEHADFAQHGGMRQRSLNILLRHAPIKSDRRSKFLDKGIGGFGKTGAGKFFGID